MLAAAAGRTRLVQPRLHSVGTSSLFLKAQRTPQTNLFLTTRTTTTRTSHRWSSVASTFSSSSSSSSSTTTTTKVPDPDKDGPVSWYVRARDFPNNVRELAYDLRRLLYIRDSFGRRSRRQQEQVRMTLADVRVVTPTVLLWIPPIIGFLPLFLAIFTPRQVLSRQFFNTYERQEFAVLESNQRHQSISQLQSYLPTTTTTTSSMDSIYRSFPWSSLVDCSALHLRTLALATGYAQRFPLVWAQTAVRLSPPALLRNEIGRVARQVYTDDTLLLEESYHTYGCEGMTDDELLEACLLRGIPIASPNNYPQLQKAMTQHLRVMEELRTKHQDDQEKISLFALHLPALQKSS